MKWSQWLIAFGLASGLVALSGLVVGFGGVNILPGVYVCLAVVALTFIVRAAIVWNWKAACGGLFGLIVILGCIPTWSVALGCGYKSVPIRFLVADSDHFNILTGATVRLHHAQHTHQQRIADEEADVEGVTDADGTVVLTRKFFGDFRDGWFEHSGVVYFSQEDANLFVEITAPGYDPQTIALETLTGRSRDVNAPLPLPVTIYLLPEQQAQKSRRAID